jgi:hypothetical protein
LLTYCIFWKKTLLISVISGEALHRSARPSSISLKIGIVRVLNKKQTSIFYLGQKASHKKKLQDYQLFYNFSIIHSLITQRVFIAENCAWARWKVFFIEENSKEKKINNKFFFFLNVWFRWLEMEFLKIQFF